MASASCRPESIQLVTTAAATSRPNPLSTLPDLCLLALFEQLPLLDQLTTRQTCARWSILLRQVTQTRRTLDILVDYNPIVNYDADMILDYKDRPAWFHFWCYSGATGIISQLQKDDGSPLFLRRRLTAWSRFSVDSLSATLSEQICTAFSRIKKLELQVYVNKPSDDRYLVSLVEQLGPRLEAFHLNLYHILLDEPMLLADRLFAAINSMSSLLYLNIELNEFIPHYDLPIISHLEELHFNCDSTTPDQFAEMLHQYGEGNGALRRIEYHKSGFRQPLQLAPLTRLSRRLRHCFTSFVFSPPSDIDKLSLCDHFHSITSFHLSLNFRITIRRLFAHLSQLTQLTLLNLSIFFNDLLPDSEASHLHRPLPQLPSVVVLQLQPFFRSHRDLDQLALPWTMPNLQVICFSLNFKCTDCRVTVSFYPSKSANLEPLKECARQLFRPLMAQCGRLRLIWHNWEYAIGTAEELLALDQGSRPAEEF